MRDNKRMSSPGAAVCGGSSVPPGQQSSPDSAQPSLWPKKVPDLTAEQERIKDDFMAYWLSVLPQRYGAIEVFNQHYSMRNVDSMIEALGPDERLRTLEIGCGLGEHIALEPLERQEYHALDLRQNLVDHVLDRFPGILAHCADAQDGIPLPGQSLDRVQAIHVLEHLSNLPAVLSEVHRVLRPGGRFSVVIPCEGGLAYGLARRVSAKALFEKRYKQSYKWLIESEHINTPSDIIPELDFKFRREHREFWPLRVPIVTCNLVIGMTYIRD